jgi:CubicO group peptidase (beta-lactamase class C family)
MRFLARFLISIIIAILILIGVAYLSGNGHLIKAVSSTYLRGESGPTIDDADYFTHKTIHPGPFQAWDFSSSYNRYNLEDKELAILRDWESQAFLLLRQDSILYEWYEEGVDTFALTNSFSMAKSLASLAIGSAIQNGFIKGIDQKVADFLPEFKKGEKKEITIEHLLTMTSGIDFGESYGDPFGFMAKTYYGDDLYQLTVNKPVKHKPGTRWKYQGGNTLLLGFIIHKATGMSLAKYVEKYYWHTIGPAKKAWWAYNPEDGYEKSYCCFYSNARDFARIGKLMLDSGKWGKHPFIDKSYFTASVTPVGVEDNKGEKVDHYGYQWWLGEWEEINFFYARGIKGQYIVCIPEWDAIIVRLGHKRDPEEGVVIPRDLIEYLAISRNILE